MTPLDGMMSSLADSRRVYIAFSLSPNRSITQLVLLVLPPGLARLNGGPCGNKGFD